MVERMFDGVEIRRVQLAWRIRIGGCGGVMNRALAGRRRLVAHVDARRRGT